MLAYYAKASKSKGKKARMNDCRVPPPKRKPHAGLKENLLKLIWTTELCSKIKLHRNCVAVCDNYHCF